MKTDRLQNYLGRQFTAGAVLVDPPTDVSPPPSPPAMNTPIRVIGQPWLSADRPGFIEVLAAVPRRAQPAIDSTVSVLDRRYRVLGVSPAREPSAHVDGNEVLVRLDLEDEANTG